MDIKVFSVSEVKRSGRNDISIHNVFAQYIYIYMQLRCSTGLSDDYITSLHVAFFKIYEYMLYL
jgi:hypothetical protein